MESTSHRPRWTTLLAFGIIYFVWGSTFLAIRVGVQEVPPLLLAGMRFLVAGLVLYAWTMARGERSPTGRQWVSAVVLATLIFVVDYGLLFWAEQRVPSGPAAVMMATIPAFMALSEIVFLRTQRLTLRLVIALAIGIIGVAVLTSRSVNLGGAPIDRLSAIALIIGSISWSVASALTRKLQLPSSKVVSSAAQMLAGGLLLTAVSATLGEFSRFHPSAVSLGAWLALLYLIVAGVDRWIYRLCLAHPSRIADEGGNLRLCEPGCGCAAGILSGRRSAWDAHRSGNRVCARQCRRDHYYSREQAGGGQGRSSRRITDANAA